MTNACSYATVGGGTSNTALGYGSVVGGGDSNKATHKYASVFSGKDNSASGYASGVGGGRSNAATAQHSWVGGGSDNMATGNHSGVGNGNANVAIQTYATVGGGHRNNATGYASAVGGGEDNTAAGGHGWVGGGNGNTAGAGAGVTGGVDNVALGIYSWIGGGRANTARALYSGVGNGFDNEATGNNAWIGGGRKNAATAVCSEVGGGSENSASGYFASVGGGGSNNAKGPYTAVAGGISNTASAYASCVGGGRSNTATGPSAWIGGGSDNMAAGNHSGVVSGNANAAMQKYASVGGGHRNNATGYASAVGGGEYNTAAGGHGWVGGGLANAASANYSEVSGGSVNLASGYAASVGGGLENTAMGRYSGVASGRHNGASAYSSYVGGGNSNTATGVYSGVGSGNDNHASAYSSRVGGGRSNTAAGDSAWVGGGYANKAAGNYSGVGNGNANTATRQYATVGGGYRNNATGYQSVVGGGAGNAADRRGCVVSGGQRNIAQGAFAVVSGGQDNFALGNWSTVVGGTRNSALATGAAALGIGAVASHTSAAVLSFAGANETCRSAGNSTITMCAPDGVFINGQLVATASAVAHVESQIIDLEAVVAGSAADANASADDIAWLKDTSTTLTSNVSALQHAATGLQEGIAALREETVLNSTVLQAQVVDLSLAADATQQTVDTINATTLALQTEISTMQIMDTVLANNATELARRVNNARDSIDSLNASAVATERDVTMLRGNATVLADDVDELQDATSVMQDSLSELRQNVSSTQDGILAVQSDVDDLADSNAALWRNASAQEATLSFHSAALHALNQSVSKHDSLVMQDSTDVHQLQASVSWLASNFSLHNSWLVANNATIKSLAAASVAGQMEDALLRGMVDSMNVTLAAKDAKIEAQQAEIDVLAATVAAMNSSLAAVIIAMEQMEHATTFARTTRAAASEEPATTIPDVSATGCTSDGPCGVTTAAETHATGSSVVQTGTSLSPSTEAPLPDLAVRACAAYPCDGDVDVFSWTASVAVVATVDVTLVAVFQFSLRTKEGAVIWEQITDSRFASFVPSALNVSFAEDYYLHVAADLVDGRTQEADSEALLFAFPPMLHSVDVNWVNSSAAANWFEVVVNATDTNVATLTFEYWVVDADGLWQYLASSGTSAATVVAVPSSKNATLHVTVMNSFASSASCTDCPTLSASQSAWDFSIDEVLQDALQLVKSGTTGSAVLLSALDVAQDDADVEALVKVFLESAQSNDTALSQDVVVLNAVVASNPTADGVMDLVQDVGSKLTADAGSESLELFLDTVGDYGTALTAQDDALDGVAAVDEYLGTVCAADVAGGVPDGQVSVFSEDSYSLSCASSENVVAVETGSATVLAAVEGVSTVAVSTWNGTTNMTAATNTSLLASIHGVHVEGGRADGDAVDVHAATTLKLELSTGETHAIRKAASCMYYDEVLGAWSKRGIVLRGMELASSTSAARMICASSHLTLFTVGDTSAAARVVEDKLMSFAARVERMNNATILGDGTTLNWNIMGVFVGMTVLFAIVIVAAKAAGRKAAVERGRLTFQQDGRLSKPNAMGSAEYEAVLRGWVTGFAAVKLVVFELLTSNAILGLLFSWDHEEVVFGRADKAVTLYGAVLMTFVSSAFLLDTEEDSTDSDPLIGLWSTLVAAAFANILLLPVQHFLPYMVSNVNSVTTMTKTPMALLQREMKRRRCWKPATRARSDLEVQSHVVTSWLAHEQQHSGAIPFTQQPQVAALDEPFEHVSTGLKFLCCKVALPSASVAMGGRNSAKTASRRDSDNACDREGHGMGGIVRLQRMLRLRLRTRRETRRVEFTAWYEDLRCQRTTLAVLSTLVLVVLAAFTLSVCLLLSGTFNDDESLMWAVDVGQSLVIQIFVTDPTITLLLIFAKLGVSTVLLRAGKRRVRRQLQSREHAVEQQLAAARADARTVQARAQALQVVAAGSDTSVAREAAAKKNAAKRCGMVLQDIAMAKTTLIRMRDAIARPKKVQLETWDAEESALTGRERTTRDELRCIEAALEVLSGGHGDAAAELAAAREAMERLRCKMAKLAKAKVTLLHEAAKLEEKPQQERPRPAKRAAIVPLASSTLETVEEPDLERVTMPAVRQASSAPTTNKQRARRRARNSVQSRAVHPTGNETVARTASRARTTVWRSKPATGGGASAGTARPRRAMTWAEIRALQKVLKAKAAKEAASRGSHTTTVRSRSRGKGVLGRLSPKALKAIMDRRVRRQKLLEERRKGSGAGAMGDADAINM